MPGLFQNFGEKIAAVSDQGESLSYDCLFSKAAELAGAVGSRTLVFAMCGNRIGSLVGYVAFYTHGIVPLLLSAKLDQGLFGQLLEIYRPQYLWIPDEREDLCLDYEAVYACYGWKLFATGFPRAALYEKLALLLPTSGSTGSPKLVRQSYRNMESNTASIISYLKLDASQRPITTLPMHYTYGLSIINTHLAVGATLLLTEKSVLDHGFWDFFQKQGATSFGGVPYTYEMLDKLGFVQMDLPTLRTMTQAGGKLSLKLHKKFAAYALRRQKEFVVMYGQTEATARMAYLPAEKSIEKSGSMGIAVPGGRFELVNTDGSVIDTPDTVGELVYYGANVTLGYASRQADLCAGDVRGGKLLTGDMAKRDADGYYYIVGRKKRFLKLFGNRIGLDECEQLVRAAFPETDCACVGEDDQMHVFLTQETAARQVKQYLAEQTKLHPSAFCVHVAAQIPKQDTGKINYRNLEEKAGL